MRRPRDTIRDGLAQVWNSGGREFVTFELVRDGRADADQWVQWLDGVVNLRWPHDDDPRTALPRLGAPPPPSAVVGSHQPGGNAIVHAPDSRIDDVAEFIDRCFQRVLGAGARYEIAVRVETQ